ncbi:MAG: flagellar biosynthesis protein FlhB [Actinomycetes bacterium]|jgi:flagellar biosynthetic protein FlhB|uniref:Flagellar biosynthetic protein FlhB n=1 Tax=freshwater metagenome TaxID=449393 RepID=A0A6J6H781_9ZZZZ|nr:flagellar biosynthesis protein FlhB [Actinomycetota bacterium]
MSKRDGKTELPTQKKKRESRQKGTVAKSQDLGPWIALLVGTYLVPLTVGSTAEVASDALGPMRELARQPDPNEVAGLLGDALLGGLIAMLPMLALCLVIGVVVQMAQVGLLLTLKPLKPDLRKIDPIQGLKRLFSAKSLWDTAKQIAKAGVIAWLCWPQVMRIADVLVRNGRVPLMEGLATSGDALLGMTRTTCYAVIVIALIDYGYQRRSTLLDMKMTKQEVRDEMKNSEGDPFVKGRIRQLQVAMARSRMMNDVPTASVVITNPTHVAIALRYDPATGGAPKVVAAGIDNVALRIRERAREAGVPIVEAKPLARALWRACEVGDEIPAPLYEAVAKVLAFVRRLKGGILAASTLPLPRQYHVDEGFLEGITGRRRKRLPAA